MSSSRPLNPRQEKFARLYYAGPDEVRGTATRAYQEAYPDSSYESAKSNAYRLLTRDGVRARTRELREEASEAAKDRARSWWEMYPDAQEVLERAITGDWPADMDDQDKRSALEAAIEILDRAEGPPALVHEHRPEGEGITVGVAGPAHSPQEASESHA